MTQQPPPNWYGGEYPGQPADPAQYPQSDPHAAYPAPPAYPDHAGYASYYSGYSGGYSPGPPTPPRKRWPWYVGGAAVVAAGALTAVLVLQGGSDAAGLPSLRDSLVADSSFPDGATVSDPTQQQSSAADAGIGISLDAGDSEFDPAECADLLNAEASMDVDSIEVAQVTAEVDEPSEITYTQAVMELPEPAAEVASLDPLREAIESCGEVELSGFVNGAVELRDLDLPAAGDDSLALSYVVDTDMFDMALVLAALLYEDRILLVVGVTNQQSVDDVGGLDEQMEETVTGLYSDALDQAAV